MSRSKTTQATPDSELGGERMLSSSEPQAKAPREDKGKGLPCPHGRMPIDGIDGWKHCPHCLGLNTPIGPSKSVATCKTCGAEAPNHIPSLFDGLGIGNAGHRIFPNTVDAQDSQLEMQKSGESTALRAQAQVAPESAPRGYVSFELDKILGRHSVHYNYSKAETKAKLQALIAAETTKANKALLERLKEQAETMWSDDMIKQYKPEGILGIKAIPLSVLGELEK